MLNPSKLSEIQALTVSRMTSKCLRKNNFWYFNNNFTSVKLSVQKWSKITFKCLIWCIYYGKVIMQNGQPQAQIEKREIITFSQRTVDMSCNFRLRLNFV